MANEDKKSPFELRIQSLIIVMLAGISSWVAFTVDNTAKEVAVLTNAMTRITKQFDSVRKETKDVYTGKEARKDFSDVRDRVNKLEIMQNRLEVQVKLGKIKQ